MKLYEMTEKENVNMSENVRQKNCDEKEEMQSLKGEFDEKGRPRKLERFQGPRKVRVAKTSLKIERPL